MLSVVGPLGEQRSQAKSQNKSQTKSGAASQAKSQGSPGNTCNPAAAANELEAASGI